jgi:hypothetical protein
MLNERDIWHHCPTSMLMMDDGHVNDLLEQFRVGAVMALHPPVIGPEAPLAEAAALFATSDREGIPVIEDGTPMRVCSSGTTDRKTHPVTPSAPLHVSLCIPTPMEVPAQSESERMES